MKFTAPSASQIFTISAVPEWPTISFETDASGPHKWHWVLSWGTYKKSGVVPTTNNQWDASSVIANFGGTLTVRAEAGKVSATISVSIKGANPTAVMVMQYLATKANSTGFDKIISHETRSLHFNAKNEPIKSFDHGYGMCQLTTPTPTFEQVWNWKLNVDGGLNLFAQKRTAAKTFLSQSGRAYTSEQLTYETVCRWNGGSYHEWDAKAAAWVRKANVLCDSATGNIGWDTSDAENKGKTEAVLRARDKAGYSHAPGATAHWMYSGVCYADSLLG